MKQLIFSITLFGGMFFFSLAASAGSGLERSNVSISGKVNMDENYAIIIQEISGNPQHNTKATETVLTHQGTFKWQYHLKRPGFVMVSIIPTARNRQLATSFPVYLKPGTHIHLNLHYSDTSYLTLVSGKVDNGNKALIAYSNFSNLKIMQLFKHPPAPENVKASLAAYMDTADDLISRFRVKNETVKEYLDIWAFNNYLNGLFAASRERRGTKTVLPADYYLLPKSPDAVYNSQLAFLFNATFQNINEYIKLVSKDLGTERDPFARLETQLNVLNDSFTNQQLTDRVAIGSLQQFVSAYSIKENADFEKEIAHYSKVAEAVKNERRRRELINDFINLKYTLKGAEIPDITFKDQHRRDVKLQDFSGKYIYIDLWASWCVPCIKEIPSLQELEKDYQDRNIVFVSISLDSDTTAWRSKMKELSLHGNQFETAGSGYEKLMNVSGIPHFILYGPDGKLVLYKAPRPSSTGIRQMLDGLTGL